MAEQPAENPQSTGAPATPPSAEGVQSEGSLSLEEIVADVTEKVRGELSLAYRATQSQVDAAINALRKELLPSVEVGKQTRALVQRLALGESLTSEDIDAMDKSNQDNARILALEEEVAQAKRQKEALEKSGLSNSQAVDDYLGFQTLDRLQEYAKEQGVPWKEVEPVFLSDRKATKGDDHGWRGKEADVRKVIRTIADKALHEETPPPKVPGERPNGPAGSELSYMELYRRGFADRK